MDLRPSCDDETGLAVQVSGAQCNNDRCHQRHKSEKGVIMRYRRHLTSRRSKFQKGSVKNGAKLRRI